jgi:hypothetical protein
VLHGVFAILGRILKKRWQREIAHLFRRRRKADEIHGKRFRYSFMTAGVSRCRRHC